MSKIRVIRVACLFIDAKIIEIESSQGQGQDIARIIVHCSSSKPLLMMIAVSVEL
jgi:hypothetical protein